MPPVNKTVAIEKTLAETTIADVIDLPMAMQKAMQDNDWRKLTDDDSHTLLGILHRQYGFNPMDGLICRIRCRDGSVKPYITAQGIFTLSRDRVQSVEVSFTERQGYVIVLATVTSKGGALFQAYCAKPVISGFDDALMKADTGAKSRAMRVACGISLLTFSEVSSMSDETVSFTQDEGKSNENG